MKRASIAILGRPNAGKSTLLNALLEVAVSGVSKRPQTTRTLIRGIVQLYDDKKQWVGQLVLVDTPGVNFKKGLLDRSMYISVEEALRDVDVALWLSDAKAWQRDLRDIEENRPGSDKLAGWLKDRLEKRTDVQWILALTKVDLANKNELLPLMQKTAESLPQFKEIVPLAAALGLKNKNSNLDALITCLKNLAPENDPLYSEETWTDLNDKQLIQNLVREAIFRQLKEEVPYQTECSILRYQEPDNVTRRRPEVDATIVVSKDSLKPILVGHKGSRIKEIGMTVRERYKAITGDDLILRLLVKVTDKWDLKTQEIRELGYAVS